MPVRRWDLWSLSATAIDNPEDEFVIFHETELDGAWLIEPEFRADERGFFARVFCQDEFAAHGLDNQLVQANISQSKTQGTVRGMHYQLPPMMEAKYVRVLNGAIHDVIIDLRPWSPTYLRHIGVELSAEARVGIYIPPMFAHGFQALTPDVEINYMVTQMYTPGLERGIRHDDPTFDIRWPQPITVMSDKDLEWETFDVDAGAAELTAAHDEMLARQSTDNTGASA